MTSHLESRLVRLEARRPRSRDVLLRKARAAAQRIAELPPAYRQTAWHRFYLDFTNAELRIIVDGE